MQQNELTESVIYREIAKFAKGEDNKKTLERLSQEERAHAEIWKQYTGLDMKPQKGKVFKYKWLARLLGYTFAIKLMEKGETHAQQEYDTLKEEVPESIEIKTQEEEHEASLINMLDEERLQYVGSVVLGMNDALAEHGITVTGYEGNAVPAQSADHGRTGRFSGL